MSELMSQPENNNYTAERVHDKSIAHLAALVVEASMRDDLVEVVKAHASKSGMENPNSLGMKDAIFRLGPKVIAERSDFAYRSVQEPGIKDLAESGVVRGAKLAGLKGKTSSNTTYWDRGEDNQSSTIGQGYVIEAPIDIVQSKWVAANEVTRIYAHDSDGRVKNILPSGRS